ncbi:hypothetical protein A2661_02350 [Candidatus Giovannonibacteria bacterium RIFCSPHIGHO2_01_FULL_45_24]|uniref:Uncharacterized protein n=1 Tax=Candidatus Giovannonibacteria bacterium RIFCSPLOWO2_01_FULL_46_32 TaxID=1798353 RepID=A0A1F5XI45_9BACT|nr:MAG: hypothetical protein A2661_02350 [Candidatus Giovannonibacteria bacterium RIFCSPHIGHO2_01_FULL_45_24]OGF87537.1 MAG: hypothetical protein A3B19_03075 [Candidatus Giovannonibacteria bacterium RIFCSPLOWO2_01_FULL_46_32]
MIPEIDFQEGYESWEDVVEAPAKRHGIQLDFSRSRIVYLKTGVEDFATEDDEPSWLEALTWRIAESGKSVDEINLMPAVSSLLDVIGLERTIELGEFALAYLRDELDPEVGWGKYADYERPYSDNLLGYERFPRLTEAAKHNSAGFRQFQQAMNNNKIACAGIPDLTTRPPVHKVYRYHAA